MRSTRFFAIVAMTTLLGATYAVAPVKAGGGDNPCWSYRDAEKGFARRINAERSERHLGKLTLDPELSKVARVHTREMVRRSELYHTPSDKLRKRVTDWIVLGENVGVGGSVSSLHDAFMNSPAHRDNVLHAGYQHLGIGTKRKDGRMWVTVIFEAITDPGTTLRMPSCK
ncbi:MAG: CAP domain-containing protein [Actinomycetota bacterium]|nr:CAP domain-containing protein [Actinomycetota bacterium]